jgi:hypothetical protein
VTALIAVTNEREAVYHYANAGKMIGGYVLLSSARGRGRQELRVDQAGVLGLVPHACDVGAQRRDFL